MGFAIVVFSYWLYLFNAGLDMNPLYILAALAILASCAHESRIKWESVDYGVIRAADSYREETHK